jgi:hypothetical protein
LPSERNLMALLASSGHGRVRQSRFWLDALDG